MKYKLSDICETVTDYVANGSFKTLADNVQYMDKKSYARLIRLVDFGNKYEESDAVWVSEQSYEFLKKSKLFGGEIIISNVGANLGTVFLCPVLSYPMTLGPNCIMIKTKETICDQLFLYYYLLSKNGHGQIMSIVSGSAMPKFNKTDLRNLEIDIPDLETQKKIVKILSVLDQKNDLNDRQNISLYEIAEALFIDMFGDKKYGEKTISDYLLPKRGRPLLSKDAVAGNIPVVAGGLEAATYHNKSNTKSPVITISASGANAGYVRLWGEEVWSSDSSFIDGTITEYIYFWYVMLKNRQKEIFDIQTGSAQAHIYPKHIGGMSIGNINEELIKKYNDSVKPLFEKIAQNDLENKTIVSLRNTMLPKLVSGEINLDKVEL